jgi:hypothetical protein
MLCVAVSHLRGLPSSHHSWSTKRVYRRAMLPPMSASTCHCKPVWQPKQNKDPTLFQHNLRYPPRLAVQCSGGSALASMARRQVLRINYCLATGERSTSEPQQLLIRCPQQYALSSLHHASSTGRARLLTVSEAECQDLLIGCILYVASHACTRCMYRAGVAVSIEALALTCN